MTTPSLYEATGICVSVHRPLALGGDWLENLTDYSSYTHTISANGGYRSASLSCSMPISDLEDWFDSGIGRHLVVYNAAQQVVWEGFVNEAILDTGVLQERVGPLLAVRNRVWANYTPLDTTANPPARGPKTVTTIVQDTISQAKYGIMESVLSLGELLPAVATQVCQVTLEDGKEPETSHDVGEAGTPTLTLNCLGYYDMLDKVMYNDTAAGGSVTVSDPTGATGKLQRVVALANAANSWMISANYTRMVSNAALAPRYENEDKTCKSVIEELTALGEPTNFKRCTFGLYAGRVPYYQIIPSDYDYVLKAWGQGISLENGEGGFAEPWDVLPARWTFLSDFLAGKPMSSTLRQDRRNIFIENVTYTAPYGLQLNGNKVGTLKQFLAQYGLGGSIA